MPYSFGLDRMTTGRGAVARNSPIPFVDGCSVPIRAPAILAFPSREFFDPFYGVCSVRIIYPLNYISIPPLVPSPRRSISFSLLRHTDRRTRDRQLRYRSLLTRRSHRVANVRARVQTHIDYSRCVNFITRISILCEMTRNGF